MHPVHEFRQEVAQLQDQIVQLQARLNAVAGPAAPAPDPSLPPNTVRDHCGLLRNAVTGDLVLPSGLPSYEERQATTRDEAEAKRKAEWAAMTAGCPVGTYRDFGGILREIDTGRVVAAVEREAIEREAVARQQGVDHRAWKESQHLPVHPLPDDED